MLHQSRDYWSELFDLTTLRIGRKHKVISDTWSTFLRSECSVDYGCFHTKNAPPVEESVKRKPRSVRFDESKRMSQGRPLVPQLELRRHITTI